MAVRARDSGWPAPGGPKPSGKVKSSGKAKSSGNSKTGLSGGQASHSGRLPLPLSPPHHAHLMRGSSRFIASYMPVPAQAMPTAIAAP
jgi:hypothetical protein